MNKLSAYIYRQNGAEKAGVDFSTIQDDVRTLFQQVSTLKNLDTILTNKEDRTDDISVTITTVREILDGLVAMYFASKGETVDYSPFDADEVDDENPFNPDDCQKHPDMRFY